MPGPAILCLAYALSGAAGLLLQVAWFHRTALVFGGSVGSIALVFSSFMGGLALGNFFAGRFASRVVSPFRVYAGLEIIVGVTGVMTTLLLPALTRLLMPLVAFAPEASWQLNVIRLAAAFVVLVVPATAMGATFPVLAAAASDGTPVGVTIGRLYGWNTVGAVAGALLADAVAVPVVGVAGTAVVAAGFNVAAAALALLVSRYEVRPVAAIRLKPSFDALRTALSFVEGRDATGSLVGSGFSRTITLLSLCAFLAGFALLVMEVVWFRFLTMFVLSTTQAASLMLAAVLSGMAVGGLTAAVWLKSDVRATRFTASVAYGGGLALMLSYFGFHYVTEGTQVGETTRVLWFALALTWPTAVMSGVLFTLLGHGLDAGGGAPARTAARLTLFNTLGALAGPLAASFFLLPVLGMQTTMFLMAVLYAAIGVAAGTVEARTAAGKRASPPRVALVTLGALIAILALLPSGTMRERYFARAAAAYAADGSKVVALREGASETIFLMQQQWMGQVVYNRLVTNGFSMTGTAVPGLRYMRYFAYWPMLVHDGPIRKALLVCYGAGVTASAVLQIPSLESLDVAELSPDIVAVSDLIYPADQHPLRDRRTRLHLEDGRFFLEATTERFDLITGEPPPPRTPGTVNIYTREYFQLIRDRLADGGIATYSLPVARPDPGTDVDTVIRAFCDVFDDCSLWNATPFDFMLAGTRQASGPVTADAFAAPWQTPRLQASLRDAGFERPEQIGATFLGDAAYLRELTQSTPPLTDDFPERLRPVASRPSLSDPGYASNAAASARFQAVLDPARAARAFAASPFIKKLWPEAFISRSLPYFAPQAILNQAIWDGGKPLAHIEDLHTLLTTTTLRTLPLWVLGSDDVRQRIAETADDGTGASDYAHGLRALSGRDYAGAAAALARAGQRGYQSPSLTPLRAYALMMAGQSNAANELARTASPATPEERHFWDWLERRTSMQ